MALILSAHHLETLREHSQSCWPEEACALLVGAREAGNAKVNKVVPAANVAENKGAFFEVDPAVRIRLERELRQLDDEIIGVFHTHPGGPAAPSGNDEKMVIEKHFIWLIAAMKNNGISNISAYQPLESSGFSPVPLSILDE